jgi:hypothetical protein
MRSLLLRKPLRGYDRIFGTGAYLLLSLPVDDSKVKVLARKEQQPRIPRTQTQTPSPPKPISHC